MYYVETHAVINFANYVFDYNGWSSSIKEFHLDYLEEKGGRWSVGASCIVKIMLKDGTFHEDVGYGSCANMPDRGNALEKVKKEAASDALKRALRLFGNGLGNCIYGEKKKDKAWGWTQTPNDCAVIFFQIFSHRFSLASCLLFFLCSDKDYLQKLGKGQIHNPPLDLSANRPRKRNRFIPMSKEEIRLEEQQPHRPQPVPTSAQPVMNGTTASAGASSPQVSPKLNKSNVYAAAASAAHHQLAASATAVPPANPYKSSNQQPPQPVPSPQWSPAVKNELTSPTITAAPPTHSRPPTAYSTNAPSHPSSTTTSVNNPNRFNPTSNAPQTNITSSNPYSSSTQSNNPWQQPQQQSHQPSASSTSSLPPLQSNFAQQNLMNQSAAQQHQQQQQQQQQQQHVPQPMTTPAASSFTAPYPTQHTQPPHSAANPSAPYPSSTSFQPTPTSSRPVGSSNGHVPASFLAAPNTSSKLDNDLDDDLLANMIEQHSPQKSNPAPNGAAVSIDSMPSAHLPPRQLQLSDRKDSKSPSLNCSPASVGSHHSQQSKPLSQPIAPTTAPTVSSPSTASEPTKPSIFTVDDLLQDHEREQNNSIDL